MKLSKEAIEEVLAFLRHFREISMKVLGTVLPDMEGGRRGWVGSLAHFT